MAVYQSTRAKSNEVNTAIPDCDLFELLCQKLMQREGNYAGTTELAELLQGVLSRLVRELSGADRESVMDDIGRLESLFTQAASALRFALDVAPSESSSPLNYFGLLFEQQLEQVCRLCTQHGGGRSAPYIDRVSLKDALHALLDTTRALLRCRASDLRLNDAALPSLQVASNSAAANLPCAAPLKKK